MPMTRHGHHQRMTTVGFLKAIFLDGFEMSADIRLPCLATRPKTASTASAPTVSPFLRASGLCLAQFFHVGSGRTFDLNHIIAGPGSVSDSSVDPTIHIILRQCNRFLAEGAGETAFPAAARSRAACMTLSGDVTAVTMPHRAFAER